MFLLAVVPIARIEDLRMVASFVKGKKKADDVEVWIVPGSKQVEKQAMEEGIDKIFEEAGFMLRQPGCSACLGMNEDKIPAGKYCMSAPATEILKEDKDRVQEHF